SPVSSFHSSSSFEHATQTEQTCSYHISPHIAHRTHTHTPSPQANSANVAKDVKLPHHHHHQPHNPSQARGRRPRIRRQQDASSSYGSCDGAAQAALRVEARVDGAARVGGGRRGGSSGGGAKAAGRGFHGGRGGGEGDLGVSLLPQTSCLVCVSPWLESEPRDTNLSSPSLRPDVAGLFFILFF
ncbi:hypothetical protein DFJ73DRAFT_796541, partial [Zopfochytrium polystomum]